MIIPVSAGSTQSVCHLTPVFKLTGGSPLGGFWSGPYTDSIGNFNPQDTGSFMVTYHATNGCSAKKSVRVNANPIILNPIADTICASAANWQYQVKPARRGLMLQPLFLQPKTRVEYMNSGDGRKPLKHKETL
jgi:hypothetical protein